LKIEVSGFLKTLVNVCKTTELQMIREQGREMEKSVTAYVWEDSFNVVDKLTNIGKLGAKL
jgi:hypothetical protein